MPLHTTQEVPEGAIKLISYNVCSYGGNYKYENGFETVRDYLKEQQPDIVCVQEDADTWRRYVMKEYAKVLPYNDTIVLANNDLTLNALGIHTRYPIVKRERIPYSSLANGSAAWWLKVGEDTLIVVNNHFESCHLSTEDRQQYRHIIKGEIPRDSLRTESAILLVKLAEANAKRAGQIRAVRDYVKEHANYPVIVCGDFNDNPISYSRHTMGETLTDCFVATGRGIGLSYNQKAFSFRIDHIFCSKDIQPYNCQVDDKMDASDHYPLICWLKIRWKQ
jgi:endonuclease/exonuclease/phosphatase family metal-dependent hydrolase